MARYSRTVTAALRQYKAFVPEIENERALGLIMTQLAEEAYTKGRHDEQLLVQKNIAEGKPVMPAKPLSTPGEST